MDVDGGADPGRIAGCRTYPGSVEIEIRAGFCNPDGELLAVLERSGWRRLTAQRRGEIAGEMLCVCETTDVGIAEAWQRRPDQPRFRNRLSRPFSPGERAMTTPGSPSTMAPADLLIGLLERVPMSEAQIARATQAEPETIQAWLRQREAPAGLEAQRLTELVAFVEEMARNIRGDALAEWLDSDIDFLNGGNPLDELAAGGYERLIQPALGVTHSIFTSARRDSSSPGQYFIGAVLNKSRLSFVCSCNDHRNLDQRDG